MDFDEWETKTLQADRARWIVFLLTVASEPIWETRSVTNMDFEWIFDLFYNTEFYSVFRVIYFISSDVKL